MALPLNINGHHEEDVGGDNTALSELRGILGATAMKFACGEPTCGGRTGDIAGGGVRSCPRQVGCPSTMGQAATAWETCPIIEEIQYAYCRSALMSMNALLTSASMLTDEDDCGAILEDDDTASVGRSELLSRHRASGHDELISRHHDMDARDLGYSREPGLLIGFVLSVPSARYIFAPAVTEAAEDVMPATVVSEGFIRIDEGGVVTLAMPMPEMKQGGVSPSMLLAEELDVRLDQVQVQHGSPEAVWARPVRDVQDTADPMSTCAFWSPLRQAGAVARHLLTEAAAKQWDVDPGTCLANNGVVFDASGSKYLSYGELVSAAAKLSVPPAAEVKLKDPKNFTILVAQAKGEV